MADKISSDAVLKATGKKPGEWFNIIIKEKMGELSHKEIAAFLWKRQEVPHWWAQEITVMYEKSTGRRITGQTKDSGFQLGVSRTFPVEKDALWQQLTSSAGWMLLLGEELDPANPEIMKGVSREGIVYKMTTYTPYSHLRMQWRHPDWKSHSILQVRVTGKKNGKTILSVHQEKLDGKAAREMMKGYWKERMDRLKMILPSP